MRPPAETTSILDNKRYRFIGRASSGGTIHMARTVIDLDEDMVTEAMRIFGA
jgi:hypothetical protein